MAGLPKHELQTRYAREASDLSVEFVKALGGERLGPYVAELTGPEGVSTRGGELAVLHVRLVARDGSPALHVGTVQVKTASAELRSYERLDAIHRGRYESAVPVDRGAYEAFLSRVDGFLKDQGFRSQRLELTPSVAPPPRAKPSSPARTIVFLAVVALIALVVALVAAR